MKNWTVCFLFLGSLAVAGCGTTAVSSAPAGNKDAATTADGGPAAGKDAAASTGGKLSTGKDYSLVYSFNCANLYGAEGSGFTDVTFDAKGQMTGYMATTMQGAPYGSPPSDARTIGTGTVTESGNNGEVAWGRWQGGTTAGTTQAKTLTCSASDGLHYGVAKHNGSKPAGTTTYEMIGATSPTQEGAAAVGKITSATLVLDATAKKTGLDIAFEIGGTTYKVATTGGTTDVTKSELGDGGPTSSSIIGGTAESYGLRILFGGTDGKSVVATFKGADAKTYKYFSGVVAFHAK